MTLQIRLHTFIDGNHMSDAIPGIQHDSRCTSRGVERQHRLDGNVESGHVERLEHDLKIKQK